MFTPLSDYILEETTLPEALAEEEDERTSNADATVRSLKWKTPTHGTEVAVILRNG